MGTYTTANVFYKPIKGASGDSEKVTFDAALDKTARIIAGSMAPGVLVNGKIDYSINGSGDLNVRILTVAGTNPSTLNPVWCRVGSRVVTIKSALGITRTHVPVPESGWNPSWLNLAKPPVNACETDLFVYTGWNNARQLPYIAVSRHGFHNQFVFESETSGHGAMCSLTTSFNYLAPSYPYHSLDEIAVSGRIAVTLTTPNTWSTPASGSLIVQRPTQDTRLLKFNPNWRTYSHFSPSTSMKYYGGGTMSVAVTYLNHYAFNGQYINLMLSTYLYYYHANAAATRTDGIFFDVPLSVQDYAHAGAKSFGAVTMCTAGGVLTLERAPLAVSQTGTDEGKLIKLVTASQASYTPSLMYVTGQYRVYLPGTRLRFLNF